jgi:hypothetical protein
LCRSHLVAEREPRAIDSGRERVDGEVRDGTVVGERLHQRERDAAGDRGPRERQVNAPERAPCVEPHRPAGFVQRSGPFQKCGAREQVDIRVQHSDEHRRGTDDGAHIGKPIVALRPAERLPQRALHRSRVIEPAGVGIGQHIRGHRERQQQGPFEEARTGETAIGDEPCRDRSTERDTGADQHDEDHGVDEEAIQHRLGEVLPHRAVAGSKA